jgi:beta-glucosidase
MDYKILNKTLSFLAIALVILFAGCTKTDVPAYSNPELTVKERLENILSLMTLEEKAGFLTGRDMWHIKGIERLGIPSIRLTDCGHGVTVVLDSAGHNSGCATCFPTAVGQASTWNRELVKEVGAAIARETRALGASILLAPMVNIHRSPLGGRNYETYSEDPFLTGTLASSFIQGVQSEHIGAVIKAATANNQQTNQGQHSVEVSERALREIYLPGFKIPVMESNPWGIMTSYNKVNGEYTSASKHLISEIIKGEWKYPGFLVSDWRGTHSMKALFAGLDLEMPGPGKILTKEAILKEIEQGHFTEEELDSRVGRILTAIIKTHLLDSDQSDLNAEWDTQRHHVIARKTAEEAIVLLQNKHGVLPLDIDDIESLAVIGPNAREARLGGGGSASVTACHTVCPLDGIRNHCKDSVRVLFEEGCGMKGSMPIVYTEFLRSMEGNQPVQGIKGEYFWGKELKGDPVLVRFDDKIDFSWGWAAPCQEVKRGDYSVRWTGKLIPPVSGEYSLGISCTEAGVRMYLDSVLVIDQWGDPYNETFEAGFKRISESVRIRLDAGVPREVRVEFHPKANRNSIRLEWEIPGKRDPIAEAVRIASESDVAIVFAGLSNLYEGGTQDRESLLLPEQQNKLIRAVARANPKTILVLINGTPVAMPWIEEVPAILEAYYPGQEGGNAIARILFGAVNPSGKLPETFPRKLEDNPSYGNFPGDPENVKYEEGIYVGYRHYDINNIEPLFPFGFGLSYTDFSYSNLQTEQTGDNLVKVRVEVKNTGSVPGKEVVQLYIRDPESVMDKPEKELKGFTKVFLEPGQSKPVSMKLARDRFAHFEEQKGQWVVEPGEYEIWVGSYSRDIRLKGNLTIE